MSIDRLQQCIRALKNPTMVSLGPGGGPPAAPSAGRRCGAITAKASRRWPRAYEDFSRGILDALQDLVPAVKVQAGCYQALGPRRRGGPGGMCWPMQSPWATMSCWTRPSPPPPSPARPWPRPASAAIPVGTQRFTPLACDGLSLQPLPGQRRGPGHPALHCQDKSLFLQARTANKSAREMQDLRTPATGCSTRWSWIWPCAGAARSTAGAATPISAW